MMNFRYELGFITEILLRTEDRYDELTQAIENLNRLFLATSGLKTDLDQHREALLLPSGKAIGPVWAGMCVQDILRTKRFLRGVYLGIRSALERFSVRPVRVLYAGTGPFATLVMPLTTVFSSKDIRFTMLEVSPESIKCLKRVITAFQAEDFVAEIIYADAARHQANPEKSFHIIISETMQNALQKEPQVAITLNLISQLADGGIFIPENIEVEAVLLNPQKNRQRMVTGNAGRYYHSLGKIFELNLGTARQYANVNGLTGSRYCFPTVELEIPARIAPGYSWLCLFTAIRIFETEQLNTWESSLTMPQQIMNLNQATQPIEKICYRYKVDEQPGFEHICQYYVSRKENSKTTRKI